MHSYKHVLLATDFSSASKDAATKACGIAEANNARLTVLHVVSYIPPGYASVSIPAEFSSPEKLVDRAEHHMTEWVAEHISVDFDAVTIAGQAKKLIPDTAEEKGADLIVVGSHGETGLTQIFGSIANAVVHRAHCDVLVVRE